MKHSTRSFATRAAGGLAVTLVASPAFAWLGSFEGADGYQPFLDMVQNYNAGQYGANSGYGGGYSPIPPNSGLWKAINGGFSSGGAISYATGHQFFDRSWVNNGLGSNSNQGLVLTTGHEGWNGPALKYRYDFDQFDLGGVDPMQTGNKTVCGSVWWCAELAGPEIGGALADGYFGDEIQFLDSAGNIGMSIGLTQRGAADKVTYWDGTTMFESGLVGPAHRYDRIDFILDLATDTFSLDYFHFPSGNLTPLVTNASMMQPMSEFRTMSIRTSPGVNNHKLMSIDDFSAKVVPEPATMTALGTALAALARRRRTSS